MTKHQTHPPILKKIANLFFWAGISILMLTLISFSGRWFWASELLCHFRVHLLLTQMILVALCLPTRCNRHSLFLLTAAIPNLVLVLPRMIPDQAHASNTIPAGSTFRTLMINVNSQTGDPTKVLSLVHNFQPDIILLIEITSDWKSSMERLDDEYPYQIIQTREDNFGIGFYSKLPIEMPALLKWGKAEIPYIMAELPTQQGPIQLIGIHPLPPTSELAATDRNGLFTHLPSLAHKSAPMIIMGDFNATLWSPHVNDLRKNLNLNAPNGLRVTWPTFAPWLGIAIDLFLHSQEVIVLEYQSGPDIGSDHYPVLVTWKMQLQN